MYCLLGFVGSEHHLGSVLRDMLHEEIAPCDSNEANAEYFFSALVSQVSIRQLYLQIQHILQLVSTFTVNKP